MTTKTELEKRFDAAIERARFTLFEIMGFKTDHLLAVKVGVAIGYRMAVDELNDALNKPKLNKDPQ